MRASSALDLHLMLDNGGSSTLTDVLLPSDVVFTDATVQADYAPTSSSNPSASRIRYSGRPFTSS